ncbi:MAG: hypothetical protein FWC73_03585 [Defluviitaleaceae bacterium]|nr:hypothetical protein [Defluviitaleaceae bacterium]
MFVYTSVGAIAKANASLLFDPALKLENMKPEQERLLQATRNYAKNAVTTTAYKVKTVLTESATQFPNEVILESSVAPMLY